jgi:hypothetical protein
MTTAMMTASFTGLVRAIGMLLTVIILAEFIYILLFSELLTEAGENDVFNPSRSKLLFSGACNSAKENRVYNPNRLKKAKLIAKAMGFIFFMQPGKNYSFIHTGNYHSFTLQQNDVTRTLFANPAMQNPTTCL